MGTNTTSQLKPAAGLLPHNGNVASARLGNQFPDRFSQFAAGPPPAVLNNLGPGVENRLGEIFPHGGNVAAARLENRAQGLPNQGAGLARAGVEFGQNQFPNQFPGGTFPGSGSALDRIGQGAGRLPNNGVGIRQAVSGQTMFPNVNGGTVARQFPQVFPNGGVGFKQNAMNQYPNWFPGKPPVTG